MRRAIAGAVAVQAAVAVLAAPTARADMQTYANYELHSNRWTDVAWMWTIYPCQQARIAEPPPGCFAMGVVARPAYAAARFTGIGRLVDGRYSFTAEVPDGLRCMGTALPTSDTYSWDANTLAGTIESHFDVGCFNGPPGVNTWTFALVRI